MNAIKRYLTGLVLGKWIKPILSTLNGRKTVLGAVSLFLWVWIYAVPTLWPELAYLADWGKQIRDLLEGQGVMLDKELLSTGLGLTFIGLMHKMVKLFSK